MNFDSVDAILDYAIQKEEQAADFYTELAGKVAFRHPTPVAVPLERENQFGIRYMRRWGD